MKRLNENGGKNETNESQMSASGWGPATRSQKIFLSIVTFSPSSGEPAPLCRGRVHGHVNETTQVAVDRAADTNWELATPYHGRPGDEHGLHRQPTRQYHLGG
jgi:hypothetical protein